MSIVACRVYRDGFEISSDSISVRYCTQEKGENTKHAKLAEVNGIVIGGVGYAEGNSLMQLFLCTHGIAAQDERAILEFVSEYSDWKKSKTGNGAVENSYIIGVGKKAFAIEGWWVSEIKTYYAIGAGMDYALAALSFGRSTADAVAVAAKLSIFCELPVITISKRGAK